MCNISSLTFDIFELVFIIYICNSIDLILLLEISSYLGKPVCISLYFF